MWCLNSGCWALLSCQLRHLNFPTQGDIASRCVCRCRPCKNVQKPAHQRVYQQVHQQKVTVPAEGLTLSA